MANEIRRLKREVNVLLSAIGQDFDDLPDTVALSQYVWDDMSDEDIKEEAQEVFDTMCYDNEAFTRHLIEHRIESQRIIVLLLCILMTQSGSLPPNA